MPLLEYGDGTLVAESLDVIQCIGENIGSDDAMYPADGTNRARVDAFIDAFEDTIQGYYDFLTAYDEQSAEDGKLSFCHALHNLAPLLDQGPFCLGDTFSIAECYAAPWVHRFHITPQYFRGATVQQVFRATGDSDNNGRAAASARTVAAWMDAVLKRRSVQMTNGPEDYLLQSTRNYFVRYLSPNSPAVMQRE